MKVQYKETNKTWRTDNDELQEELPKGSCLNQKTESINGNYLTPVSFSPSLILHLVLVFTVKQLDSLSLINSFSPFISYFPYHVPHPFQYFPPHLSRSPLMFDMNGILVQSIIEYLSTVGTNS